MVVILSMAARHGLQTHLPRRISSYLHRQVINQLSRDVFVVWAKCRWDGKIRGFLLEKVDFQ